MQYIPLDQAMYLIGYMGVGGTAEELAHVLGFIRPDGSSERYPDFGQPGQRSWIFGPLFSDGRRMILSSYEDTNLIKVRSSQALWTAAACCRFSFRQPAAESSRNQPEVTSVRITASEIQDSVINQMLIVVQQQAVGQKAAAGCRSPKASAALLQVMVYSADSGGPYQRDRNEVFNVQITFRDRDDVSLDVIPDTHFFAR